MITSSSFKNIRSLWFGLAAMQAMIVAGVLSYLAGPGKSNNHQLIALALGVILFAAAVIGFAAWLRPARLDRLRSFAARWSLPLSLGAMLLVIVFGLYMPPEWIYAFIGLALATTLALAYWSLYSNADAPFNSRWLMLGASLFGIAVLLIRAYALSAAPTMDITDEGWSLGWAISYLRTGHLSDWLMYYGGHDVPLYYLPMALWLKLVGVGFWQARLFSFLLLLPLIYFSARAAANLYGRSTGLICGIALFSSAVVMVGARVRHDAGLGLSIAVSLWLYSEALKHDDRRRLHFLAGLAMGLGWFSHYHATILGVAMALGLYGPRYIVRLRKGEWRPEIGFWLYVLGGLTGAASVFVLQILPNFQAFLWSRHFRNASTLAGLITSIIGHVQTIAEHSKLEFLLILGGLAAAIRRGRARDWSIATTVILAHIALGIAEEGTYSYYPMPLTPLYGVLVASLFTEGWTWKATLETVNSRLRRGILIMACLFLIMNLGFTLHTPVAYVLAHRPVIPPPPEPAAWILDHVPRNRLVEGEHFYYLWLTDYRYVSPVTSGFMPPWVKSRFTSLAQIWEDIDPDVFILDPNLSTCCILQPLVDSHFFEDHGYTIAAQFSGRKFPITIYWRQSITI